MLVSVAILFATVKWLEFDWRIMLWVLFIADVYTFAWFNLSL